MQRYGYIEKAFQDIRTATGQSDVNEIVNKFLSREQTYSALLMAVSDNERKSDELRTKHEELALKLHELQMEHDDDEGNLGKKVREDGNPFSPEIDDLDKQILGLSKDKENSEDLCKKVNLVNDQVTSWCEKVI